MVEIKKIYDECKLCFYRSGNYCYEKSYINNNFVSPDCELIETYYTKGCKHLRIKKINKLLNET